jgi:hypothetical protein
MCVLREREREKSSEATFWQSVDDSSMQMQT